MERARLFLGGVLAQAAFGLVAVVVTRAAFRSWPAGAYTWIPGLLGVAGLLVLIALAHALAVRGLPFVLVVAAWLLGRLTGAVAAAVLPGVGIDPALLATASFGMLVLDAGALRLGAPSLVALAVQLAALALAYRAGTRARARRER